MMDQPTKSRLLVLDDDPALAQQVVRAARALGFSADFRTDSAGMDSSEVTACDVLVLDLMMPRVDGIEVLRSIAVSSAPPAIVLMSGLDRKTLEGARQLARASGLEVLGVLAKPFGLEDFRNVLNNRSNNPQERAYAPKDKVRLLSFTEKEVEAAILRGEIVIHFQPQVSLADGSWTGVEALARWHHPVHGLLFPDAFITHAESESLALPFARASIEVAIREFGKMVCNTGFGGVLSVNISPKAMSEWALAEWVLASLRSNGLAPDRLVLEITETAIASSETMALDIQTRLRMRGVRISIDDFGTGQSSLGRLYGAPFDELKIDRLFVADADSNPTSRSIVDNAIQLGHTLGMTVVAEGIESSSTFEWLRSRGCDVAQGYHVSRPMSAADVVAWAQNRYPQGPSDGTGLGSRSRPAAA